MERDPEEKMRRRLKERELERDPVERMRRRLKERALERVLVLIRVGPQGDPTDRLIPGR